MVILIVAAILGLIPAAIASAKGRSFGLWWLYGAALFIVALPHALLASRSQAGPEALPADVVATSHALLPPRAEFAADSVIGTTPFRAEPDGSILALIGGHPVRFKSRADLEAALRPAAA